MKRTSDEFSLFQTLALLPGTVLCTVPPVEEEEEEEDPPIIIIDEVTQPSE